MCGCKIMKKKKMSKLIRVGNCCKGEKPTIPRPQNPPCGQNPLLKQIQKIIN